MNDLLKHLEQEAGVGLDMSPGNSLAKEVLNEINRLQDLLVKTQNDRDNWRNVATDYCENEAECRKLLRDYDKSDSYGVDPISALIESVLLELRKANEKIKDLELHNERFNS